MKTLLLRLVLATMCMVAVASANAQAGDWGNFVFISSTLGNNANKLCLGEGLRGSDIGCPIYAPTVLPNGNVGIGTSTPSNSLHVIGASGQWSAIVLDPYSPAYGNDIQFRSNATTFAGWAIGGAVPAASMTPDLIFSQTSGNAAGWVEKMRIVSGTGNVGISNTNPIAKLDVWGSISASDAIQVGQSNFSCINQISGSIRFNTTSNTLQVCTNAGWVSLASGTTGGGTISGAGSATAVAYWNSGTGLTYDSDGFYWDAPNNRLGIGTNSPTANVVISANSGASPTTAIYGVPLLHVIGTNATPGYNILDAFGSSMGLLFRRANNTAALPAALNANDNMGVVGFTGYAGSGYSGSMAARIGAYAAETWTDTNQPAYLTFMTKPSNDVGTPPIERVRIASDGKVGIGTTTPIATLQVSGTFTVSQTGQTASPSLYVASDGRVGIATTNLYPGAKLNLGGMTTMRDNAGGDARFMAYSGDGNVRSQLFAFNGLGGYVGTHSNHPFIVRVSDTNRLVFDTSGSVGLGTATPAVSLTVIGEVQVSNSGVACSGTTKGSIRYSNTSNTLEYCNSTTWASLGPSDTTPVSFHVDRNGTNQTIAASTWVKLLFTNDSSGLAFDSNNNFDTTASRFTPTQPGKYIFNLATWCNTGGDCAPSIYKNGSQVTYNVATRTGNSAALSSVILTMNGTTDYVEAYVNSTATTINGTSTVTYFDGALLSSQSGGSSSATPAGSTGDVQFNTAGALDADTGNFYWDKTNNRLGLGTNLPNATLTISKNAAQLPSTTLVGDLLLHLGASNGQSARVLIDTFGTQNFGAPNFTLRAARGTAANPTALQTGDILGQMSFTGFGTSAYSTAAGAVRVEADQSWSDAAQGSRMTFYTTTSGTAGGGIERLRINSDGAVGIGTETPKAVLDVSGTVKIAGTGAEACVSGTVGTFRFNPINGVPQICR